MEILEFRLYIAALVGTVGIFLTFARRYNNAQDPKAGMGIAGWTVFILLIITLLDH